MGGSLSHGGGLIGVGPPTIIERLAVTLRWSLKLGGFPPFPGTTGAKQLLPRSWFVNGHGLFGPLLADFLDPEKQIRFSRVTNRLYLDMDWAETVAVGDFLVIDAYVALNPDTYTEIYNDILLKKYVTASFKKQWAMNLMKYQNFNLPGGVQFNADQLFSSAENDMSNIEETLQDKYELPPDFFTG